MLKQKTVFLDLLKILLLYLPFLILLITLIPQTGHGFDNYCWQKWAEYSFSNGISNIYNSGTDYLPLYHYVLYIYAKLQGNIDAINNNIYDLKMVSIFFEFASSLILFKILKDHSGNFYKSILFSLFYLLNISVLYNSLIWGQIDGIMTFFVFSSIYFAYKKKIVLACSLYLLAINLKLQSIIFIPLIFILIFPLICKKENLKKLLLTLLWIIIFQIIIVSPFIFNEGLTKLWKVIFTSVDRYPVVSMNAYNMWYILLDGDLMKVLDSDKFIGISYKNWGLILFFISGFFALIPIFIQSVKIVLNKEQKEISLKNIFIVGALIPLLFFFFNTQMHERYSHPMLVFLAGYAIIFKRPIPYILGSIAYFLNMDKVFGFFKFNYGTFMFRGDFIAVIFLLVIVFLFIDLYKVKFKKERNIIIK